MARSSCVLLLAVAIGVSACGDDRGERTPAETRSDAGTSEIDVEPVSDLGASCPLSCIGAELCAEPTFDCAEICVSSGVGGWCTQRCAAGCPRGTHCATASGGVAVCAIDPSVCGDGRVEGLE